MPVARGVRLVRSNIPTPVEIGRKLLHSFNYPPRIHGTSSTTPLEIGPENSINYPPRIHGTSSTTPPPSKSGRKTLLQLPPLEFTELHRLPPRNRGRKTPSTTPLEFTELHRLPPSRNRPEPPFSKPWLRPC